MKFVIYTSGRRGRHYLLEEGTFAKDAGANDTRTLFDDQIEAEMVAAYHRAARQLPVGIETLASRRPNVLQG